MIAHKTKAALQSCQCHYEKPKQIKHNRVNAGGQSLSKFQVCNLPYMPAAYSQEKLRCYFCTLALKELRIFFIKNSPDFLNASFNTFWSVIAAPRYCGEDNTIDSLIIKKGPNSDCGRIFINKLNNETIKSLAKFCHCIFFLRASHHCSPSSKLVAFLSFRRLISPSKAATTNCPVLSPGSFNCSIEPAISCGTLAAIVCDFRLTALVAMLFHSLKGVLQYVRNKKSVQHLTCSTPLHKLVLNTLYCLNTIIAKPGSARTLTGPLTTNR
ncbi:putative uncharacterized protein [Klebsiella variicola CAG:634]|nr:putative uncharacterized protein [Klebsiella variicola CAG:634]